jgi:cyclase
MKTVKKVLKWLGIIVLILIVAGATLYLIYLRPFMQKMQQTKIIKYDKELTIVLGGGGNSGILTSDSLVVVIDTKMDDAGKQLYKMVKELADKKPILVINTHYHTDHSSGNKFYHGQTIIAGGNYSKQFWEKEADSETLPTTWLKDRMDLKVGDETVTILNLAANVHTASDVVVYLHKRKMLFGGDVILNKQAPALLGNADPEGYLGAFNTLQKKFDIQIVVPGHGEMGGIEIIDLFRQYFIDMKTAVQDESRKDELIAKYKDWAQIPIFMSPGATVRYMKKHPKN